MVGQGSSEARVANSQIGLLGVKKRECLPMYESLLTDCPIELQIINIIYTAGANGGFSQYTLIMSIVWY